MKVLLSWLRDFAPIEGDPEAIGEQLSDLGLAVEELRLLDDAVDGVVVARVLETRPHPDADRIQLVDVDAGDGEALQICCGAFNMHPGDLVPLATVGTTMPGGMTIARRKLRGEWSNGMLCAPDEIGLGDDHEGIMILSADLEPGTALDDALGLRGDVLYDLEVNPNRPDAMSVAGVARDLAARLGVPFEIPLPTVEAGSPSIDGLASVDIVDPDLCGRFLVRLLRDVSVGSSPGWLTRRLSAGGMRPINSVVDVSNYVMLELGQPNHTYDAALVPGGALRVRWAREGETIETLDGVTRALTTADGVIADASDTAVGIAGVMGGASTEISDATTAVLVEMAWWDPMTIARTSTRLGLRSEASMRFERGADPEMAELAAARFCQLLAASGATIADGVVDERGGLPSRSPVRVRTERVNAFLGTSLTSEEMKAHLDPIGFACVPDGADLSVTVPSFRYDSATEVDIIEEIARHHGYGRITRTVPKAGAGRLSERQLERRQLRHLLVGLGLSEAMPMPFLAPGELEASGAPDTTVTVTNPLDARESVLRTSLRPGLLKALAFNASHRATEVGLFELGKVFLRAGDADLPDEPEHLAVALGDREAPAAVEVWDALRDALDLRGAALRAAEPAGLHPTRSAEIVVDGVTVGWVGEIDPGVSRHFEAPARVGWLEVDLDRLLALPHGEHRYRPVSRYPSSDLDLAFEVGEGVPSAAVRAAILAAGGDLVTSVELFDVYRGDQVGEGRRSLAYRLRIQAPDRTLTDDDLTSLRQAVVAAVADQVEGTLRG